MFGLGTGEIVIILFIVLLFIGPKKLPQLAKGVGEGLRELKNSLSGTKEAIEEKNPEDKV